MATIVNVGGGGKNVFEIPGLQFYAYGTNLGASNTFTVIDAKRISFDLTRIQYGEIVITGYTTESGGTGTTIAALSYGDTLQNYSYDISAYKRIEIRASAQPSRSSVNISLTNIKFYY